MYTGPLWIAARCAVVAAIDRSETTASAPVPIATRPRSATTDKILVRIDQSRTFLLRTAVLMGVPVINVRPADPLVAGAGCGGVERRSPHPRPGSVPGSGWCWVSAQYVKVATRVRSSVESLASSE